MLRVGLTLGLALWAGSVHAETDLQNLQSDERAIFRALIRETLLANPQIIAPLFAPVDLYADDAANDLAAIKSEAKLLFAKTQTGFGPTNASLTIALFTAPNCAPCQAAEAELRAYANNMNIRVNLFDFAGKDKNLTVRMGIDMAPTYVLPDMFFRGQMPSALFERYLVTPR